ncbi:MAG: hypothetical protein M1832_003023 [Thelocarpon impressellum]|nr:MAG: hypothetical protein M1832_003023 [Thelocarpon impressellum]
MPSSSKHAGYGFGGDITAEKLKSVALPPKIKCNICKKIKNNDAFSKKQLSDLAFKISRHGPQSMHDATVKCRQCTGAQVTELTCCVCGEIKGLDDFSKAQRKSPDTARCLPCVRVHEDTEPDVAPPPRVFDEYESGDDSDNATNPYETTSEVEQDEINNFDEPVNYLTFDRLTLSQTASRPQSLSDENVQPSASRSTKASGTSSIGGASGSQAPSGDWMVAARKKGPAHSAVGIPFTGYDVHGRGHNRVTVASSVTSGDEEPSQLSRKSVERSERWAKVKVSRQCGGGPGDTVLTRRQKPPTKSPLDRGIYAELAPKAKSTALQVDSSDDDGSDVPEW